MGVFRFGLGPAHRMGSFLYVWACGYIYSGGCGVVSGVSLPCVLPWTLPGGGRTRPYASHIRSDARTLRPRRCIRGRVRIFPLTTHLLNPLTSISFPRANVRDQFYVLYPLHFTK